MNRRSLRLLSRWIAAAAMLLYGGLALGQATVDLDDGTSVNVQTIYSKPLGMGPRQLVAQLSPSWWNNGPYNGPLITVTPGLAFYTANYNAFGMGIPFNIVGTDPSLGAATTTIPTVIVPLKFIFPNPGNPSLDGTNVVAATQNSPIFLTADYTTGATDVGMTQYGDAIQRSEFWNLPGFSTGYHVLLGTPTIAPTVTLMVPAGMGNFYTNSHGVHIGVLDNTYFDGVLAGLFPSYAANTLPIFLTDNVYLGANGLIANCCVLGFHNSEGPPATTAKTWIYSAYTETGTFGSNVILDVQALSHETAEWLNDPFVGTFPFPGINYIPPSVLPGTGGACIINFETGDPLEAPPIVFTKMTNGTTYHLQDEVFLWWYMQTVPSFGVNGQFTYLGTFATPATLCGPG